ncbi:hypothetical protein [Spirosoma gilvum]
MPNLPDSTPIYLRVSSSSELLDQLMKLSRLPVTGSQAEFMALFAARFRETTHGLPLRTDTGEHFIDDLISHGWIKLVSDS